MTRPTSNDVRNEIARLLRLLQEADIAPYVNAVTCKNMSGGMVRVTWAPETPGELFRGESGSIDEYCSWIADLAFSAIFYDGAIFQISYDFLAGELIGHRLLYYPCPFDLDSELLEQESLLDVVNAYRGSDNHVRLRSPIRFDFDSTAAAVDHPAVHLTLLWSHCRWPVVAPLSIGHFVRFVFKHFYPHLWEAHPFIRDWPQRLGARTISQLEERMLHISCARDEIA